MVAYSSRVDALVGNWGLWPIHLLFVVWAIPLAVVDLSSHRLPDAIVLPLWLASSAYLSQAAHTVDDDASWVRAHVVMAVSVLVLWLMAEFPGRPLGFGDVKLGGLIALHLGWHSAGLALLGLAGAFIAGGAWVATAWGLGRVRLTDQVAFGPWLIGCFYGALLVQSLSGATEVI